jgi:hypothetical protein
MIGVYMLGVVAIPSLCFSIFMLFTPESPRWLILFRNNEEEARRIFALREQMQTK